MRPASEVKTLAAAAVPPAARREVSCINFAAQYAEERERIHAVVDEVFSHGRFVSPPDLGTFEERIARYCGVRHAVAVGSGTDALFLAMKALGIGPGDEVITPPNSHFSSTSSIIQTGAQPVFADVLPDQNIDPAAVEAAITPRTKAIMPVHLTGRMADMDAIMAIAERRGLLVVEDAAQAIGSRYRERKSGSFGHAGAFSAHPLKNLNAAGDAGFVVTNDAMLADQLWTMRNNGLKDRDHMTQWGVVSRMDVLQAEILNMRLDGLDALIARKRTNVELYRALLDPEHAFIPPCRPYEFNTFHNLVVQLDDRDRLREHLEQCGVRTLIHYPIPIHLQPPAASLGYGPGSFPVAESQVGRILSLPVHPYLTEADIEYVAELINAYYA